MIKRLADTTGDLGSRFGLQGLSSEQMGVLHQATLEVMSKTGFRVEDDLAVELFAGAGARVERHSSYCIVKIPPHVVEECIRWSPSIIIYNGRHQDADYVSAPHKVSFTTFGECIYTNDLNSRQRRTTVKQDCGEVALVCDYYDEVGVYERAVNPSDVPALTQPLHNAEAIFSNTMKHTFIGPGGIGNLRKLNQMSDACVGDMETAKKRKIFSATVCPASPLTMTKNGCEIIIEAARLGIGVLSFPMPLSSATATATLAGTLVILNAENLSALVLAQLVSKGTPFTYGSAGSIMDLRLADASLGAPEMSVISTGATKMAQFYGIPSLACGGLTDSKTPDAQTGYEFGFSAMLCALAGSNFICGAGVLERGVTYDHAKMVMDMETARMIRVALKGIDVSDEKLALDVIHEVGPGSEFLSHIHTYNNMRLQSQPELFDRKSYKEWQTDGSRPLSDVAYDKAKEIISTHKVKPLLEGTEAKMRAIIDDYEKELGINHLREKLL